MTDDVEWNDERYSEDGGVLILGAGYMSFVCDLVGGTMEMTTDIHPDKARAFAEGIVQLFNEIRALDATLLICGKPLPAGPCPLHRGHSGPCRDGSETP